MTPEPLRIRSGHCSIAWLCKLMPRLWFGGCDIVLIDRKTRDVRVARWDARGCDITGKA